MRLRTLALGLTAVGLLAVGTATPSPAAEVKKYEGTIQMPAPIVSAELSGHWATTGQVRQVCPNAGPGDGLFYKFFDLKGDFMHFFVSGPTKPVINQPEPTGVWGTVQEYDFDLYAFDDKCKEVKIEGSIMTGAGYGSGSVAGKKPARYAAVAYFAGPPNMKVILEASNEKIVKK